MFDFNTKTAAVGASAGLALIAGSQAARADVVDRALVFANPLSFASGVPVVITDPFPAAAGATHVVVDSAEAADFTVASQSGDAASAVATIELRLDNVWTQVALYNLGPVTTSPASDGVSFDNAFFDFAPATLDGIRFTITPTLAGTGFGALELAQTTLHITVPEPASAAMLLGAALPLLMRRRRAEVTLSLVEDTGSTPPPGKLFN